MRKTKEKILKEKEKERIEEEKLKALDKKQEEAVDDLFVDEKKEPVFLPMNFNLLLDYFINKGKERKSQSLQNKTEGCGQDRKRRSERLRSFDEMVWR